MFLYSVLIKIVQWMAYGCVRTVNETGETLVLNKDFTNKKKGFCQHETGKIGKTRIFPS